MLVCICLSAIVVIKFSTENGCLKWIQLVVLRCWTVFFNLRFMYLILMFIDISCEMFTLIDDKGVVVCMCVYVVTPVLLLQGLVLLFVYNKEL